jgi:hypothetical protein
MSPATGYDPFRTGNDSARSQVVDVTGWLLLHTTKQSKTTVFFFFILYSAKQSEMIAELVWYLQKI